MGGLIERTREIYEWPDDGNTAVARVGLRPILRGIGPGPRLQGDSTRPKRSQVRGDAGPRGSRIHTDPRPGHLACGHPGRSMWQAGLQAPTAGRWSSAEWGRRSWACTWSPSSSDPGKRAGCVPGGICCVPAFWNGRGDIHVDRQHARADECRRQDSGKDHGHLGAGSTFTATIGVPT